MNKVDKLIAFDLRKGAGKEEEERDETKMLYIYLHLIGRLNKRDELIVFYLFYVRRR